MMRIKRHTFYIVPSAPTLMDSENSKPLVFHAEKGDPKGEKLLRCLGLDDVSQGALIDLDRDQLLTAIELLRRYPNALGEMGFLSDAVELLFTKKQQSVLLVT